MRRFPAIFDPSASILRFLTHMTSRARQGFSEVLHSRYRLAYDTPNALVEFALLRSDGAQIYNSLVRRRKQINEAFGGPLLWLRDARSPEHPFPSHTLAGRLPALPSVSWAAHPGRQSNPR